MNVVAQPANSESKVAPVRLSGMRRALALLPAGTLVTAVGVGLLGFASYVHLAIAGHSLTTDEMADMSVLWSVVFSVGYGLFLPVEQVVTRAVAARRVPPGVGTRPVWRRGLWLMGLVTAGMIALVAAGSPLIADGLYGGDWIIVAITLGGLIGVAVAAPVRGQAAGMGRFDLYAGQVGLDGVLRIVLALALAIVGAESAASFGLILLAAPVLATLALLLPVARTATPGPPATVAEVGHGLWPLVVSALLGQFMLNSVIVSARLIAPELTALTAALLAALVLIRIPALVFGAMQASLLSSLATAASAGDRREHSRLLRHGLAVISTLMVAFAIPMVAIGPWLVQQLFAAPDVLSRVDFAILSAGTWAYLASMVLGQGVMSLHRTRAQMIAWIVGAVALLLVTLMPGPVLARLEWAYLAGNAVVAGALLMFLLSGRRVESAQPATER